MSDLYFTAAEQAGARAQIRALTKLGKPVNPILHDIANSRPATQEAGINGKRNHSELPIDAVSEVYFSTDVESDGPIPGPFSMSSIGIVATSYRTKSNKLVRLDMDDPANCFYAELKPISEHFIPEAAAVSGLDRDELVRNGTDPVEAMNDAFDTIETLTDAYGGFARSVFVGYPLGFDWLFTYWYLMNYAEKGSPFGHSSHLDIKTLYSEKAGVPVAAVGKRRIPKSLHSKRKHTHHALDDAREQGDLFNNIQLWNPNGTNILTEGFAPKF
jgi:hypothetical protein